MLHVVLVGIALAWLGFGIYAPSGPQMAFLNIALPAALGVWLNDLAYKQRKADENTVKRVRETEKRIGDLEDSDIGGRIVALEDTARAHHGLAEVIDLQEREIVANRASLQLMREAVALKKATEIPVLPETYVAITQLEKQINALARDIESNRARLQSDADSWTEESRNA